jgi:hypothetical protein
MSDELGPDHDDLLDRLRAMGHEPVDPVVASEHLTAMAALGARPGKRFGRMAVAGAALVGFMFGGLGLGWADALPGPVQGVADNVLEFVDIEGPWRNRGECISTRAKANQTDEAAKAAAKEQCPKGKPEGAGRGDKVKPHADDPCKGAPAWAGRGSGPTTEEQADHDARRAACPPEGENESAPAGAGAEDQAVEDDEATELETTDTTAATTDTTVGTTDTTVGTTDTTTDTTQATTGTTDSTDSTDSTAVESTETTDTTGTTDTSEAGS